MNMDDKQLLATARQCSKNVTLLIERYDKTKDTQFLVKAAHHARRLSDYTFEIANRAVAGYWNPKSEKS